MIVKNKKQNTGFTLIELLVVIAIISLLSSIVFASLNSSRAKARDARRKGDIRQIAIAMNMLLNQSKIYPVTNGSVCIGLTSAQTCWSAITNVTLKGNDALKTALEAFLKPLPLDPVTNRTAGDAYLYTDTGVSRGCGPPTTDGHYILWQPDKVVPTSDSDCLGFGFHACCGAGNPCVVAEGNFCAYKID